MKQYPGGSINPEDFDPLTKDLIGLGYTQQEIETALFWFYNRQETKKSVISTDTIDSNAHRVLHEVERSIISPEAYGYLLELRQLGILDLSEMEIIIERAVLLGGYKVSLEDIKMFVAAQFLDQEPTLPIPGHSFYLKTPSDRVQ